MARVQGQLRARSTTARPLVPDKHDSDDSEGKSSEGVEKEVRKLSPLLKRARFRGRPKKTTTAEPLATIKTTTTPSPSTTSR